MLVHRPRVDAACSFLPGRGGADLGVLPAQLAEPVARRMVVFPAAVGGLGEAASRRRKRRIVGSLARFPQFSGLSEEVGASTSISHTPPPKK